MINVEFLIVHPTNVALTSLWLWKEALTCSESLPIGKVPNNALCSACFWPRRRTGSKRHDDDDDDDDGTFGRSDDFEDNIDEDKSVDGTQDLGLDEDDDVLDDNEDDDDDDDCFKEADGRFTEDDIVDDNDDDDNTDVDRVVNDDEDEEPDPWSWASSNPKPGNISM